MKVDLDKNLDKDVFHTNKTDISNPPKLAWNKISYVNSCKLTQITNYEKIDNFGQVMSPFDIKFK